MVLAQKWTQDLQTTNWDKAETSYVQLEGWKKMNCIRQKNDPMYVLSEVIQLKYIWMDSISHVEFLSLAQFLKEHESNYAIRMV